MAPNSPKEGRQFREYVDQAQKAVNDMPEGRLKEIAFEKILTALMDGDGRVAAGNSNQKNEPHNRPKRQKRATNTRKAANKHGQAAWLQELIAEKFFSKPRSISDILEELANRGHNLKSSDISTPLKRLCVAKMLRRKKEVGKGGKGKVFKYSNWS